MTQARFEDISIECQWKIMTSISSNIEPDRVYWKRSGEMRKQSTFLAIYKFRKPRVCHECALRRLHSPLVRVRGAQAYSNMSWALCRQLIQFVRCADHQINLHLLALTNQIRSNPIDHPAQYCSLESAGAIGGGIPLWVSYLTTSLIVASPPP